ncbi:hypothetical protein [Bacillus altitudinis]|uniref:hypothetical protein n=1 Tax=Bacillus altitudinis TaxID=293387 RepID=UPI0037C6EA81
MPSTVNHQIKRKTVLDTAAADQLLSRLRMSLSYGHIPQHLCSVSRYAIDKGKTRLPIKKRTPIKALKVLNDQRPQVLPSGQNIHVGFACLYHTMTHV